MTVVGITGPTGAGKTTALEVLAARGFEPVDCDALYYTLLREDLGFRQQLADAFGDIFFPDGTLRRQVLAAKVFADPAELARLNGLVYPAMCAAVQEKIQRCTRKGLAIDAVNLVESGLAGLCGLTVAVTAPKEVRLRRIMARDGLDRDRAAARIAAQRPDAYYRANCTLLLENNAADRASFCALLEDFFQTILWDL